MGDFIPENELEEALVRAATEPAARPEFFRRLLDSTIYFLTPPQHETKVEGVFAVGSTLTLVSWKGPDGDYLPFFSSENRVEEIARQLGVRRGILALRGRDGFHLLGQAPMPVFLNPRFPYGKTFSKTEVQKLAQGDPSLATTFAPPEGTTVRMSQFASYTHALVGSDTPAHPMIGILSSDYSRVVEEAGAVAQAVRAGLVDFVELNPDFKEGVEGYLLLKTKPFYERSRPSSR